MPRRQRHVHVPHQLHVARRGARIAMREGDLEDAPARRHEPRACLPARPGSRPSASPSTPPAPIVGEASDTRRGALLHVDVEQGRRAFAERHRESAGLDGRPIDHRGRDEVQSAPGAAGPREVAGRRQLEPVEPDRGLHRAAAPHHQVVAIVLGRRDAGALLHHAQEVVEAAHRRRHLQPGQLRQAERRRWRNRRRRRRRAAHFGRHAEAVLDFHARVGVGLDDDLHRCRRGESLESGDDGVASGGNVGELERRHRRPWSFRPGRRPAAHEPRRYRRGSCRQ